MKRTSLLFGLCVLSATLFSAPSAAAQTACAPPWTAGMSVTTGQIVSFNNNNWKAIQPEVSAAPNWQPPNVPALWSLVGPCQGSGGSCTAVPGAPTGLASANVTQTAATLNWTAVTPPANCTITAYTVFKNGTSIGTAASPTFSVSGLSPGTTSTFTVAATDSAGTGSQSASLQVTTPANTCTAVPGAPSGLTASSTTATGTTLNWKAPTVSSGCTITSYTVFQNGSSVGTATNTSFTVNGLTPATAFTFTVAANDAAGSSAQSVPLTVTTGTQTGGGNGSGRLLVGYWHDFDNGSVDLPLAKVSSNFDVVIVAFGGTTTDSSTISFDVDPAIETQAQFIADVQTLHGQNRKVLLSLGGQNGHVAINTAQDVTNFVQSVSSLIQQYGFDGIDMDIESNAFVLASGDNDFTNPKTPAIVNTINALHQLAAKFPGFMLTFAPQIEDVQEANIAFVSSFGDQLPLLWGCRDIMSWVHVQDYNSGGTNALDGKNYNQGTADFLVAMTEMLVHGFTLANGQSFPGFPAGQVALGVPAGPGAASAGVASPTAVRQALDYLINGKSFGGQYVLQNASGYPGLRGLMTWSVNWDQVNGFAMSNTVAPFLHGLPAIPPPK